MDFLALKNEVTMDKIAECLHGTDHCGNAAVAVQLKAVNVAHGIIGGSAEFAQEASVVPEVNPQPLRYCKHPLEMRDIGQHLLLEPMAEQ